MDGSKMNQNARFGCGECWTESADETCRARAGLRRIAELIDEPHFRVMLLRCRRCRQVFLSMFFETVDWADGDDPQAWVLMPVTDSEESVLVRAAAEFDERTISGIGADRRSLLHDAPKGREPAGFWRTGIPSIMHD
jgi:hypothetical protein